MKLFAVFLTLIWIASCATDIPPAPGGAKIVCPGLTWIKPDPGFEQRWTRREKEQAVAQKRWIELNCR